MAASLGALDGIWLPSIGNTYYYTGYLFSSFDVFLKRGKVCQVAADKVVLTNLFYFSNGEWHKEKANPHEPEDTVIYYRLKTGPSFEKFLFYRSHILIPELDTTKGTLVGSFKLGEDQKTIECEHTWGLVDLFQYSVDEYYRELQKKSMKENHDNS